MKDCLLLINLKSYAESLGSRGLMIARAAQKIAEVTGKRIMIAPQTIDLRVVRGSVNLPVIAQAVSSYKQGPYTGWVAPRSLTDLGVNGVLLNHHEHKVGFEEAEKQLEVCKRIGLTTFFYSPTVELVRKVSLLKPDYVVFAPPEAAISQKSISNSPELISRAFRLSQGTPLLVEGGISNSTDVKNALLSGAKGVVVSRSVVKSRDYTAVINNLVNSL